MNTNFFNQVAQLDITGDLHLTITKGTLNTFIVSVILQNNACADKAKNIIPPLNLRGTVQELDEGFFEKITRPIETASGLMVDMEAFMNQLKEVKKQSTMEKEKSEKEHKEKEAKDKKFKEAMAKSDELEKEGKYRDAWTKLPDPALFPEQAETIRKRRSALSTKFAPDLFGASETIVARAEPQAESIPLNEENTNEENPNNGEESDNWEDDIEEE